MTADHPVVIIGAGPAGLAAAHALVENDIRPIVLEKSARVGGLARTETYKGYRFDMGGHRFYTRVDAVRRLWEDMAGEDFLTVRRLSRIHYRGRFFDYPLDLLNTLSNLGFLESSLLLLSYVQAQLRSHRHEESFEQWVTNRFGRRLYELFFKAYTEKVWGIPCDQIGAEWAAQRIKGLSLRAAVANAVWGSDGAKSLIREFQYPTLGPSMMWERFERSVASCGGQVSHEADVLSLEWKDGRVRAIMVSTGEAVRRERVGSVISSMALPDLITRLRPRPPDDVLQAAEGLRHRDFILVGLIVNRPRLFRDNWIYVHSPEVRVGRVQNFGNWSAAMVPDPSTSGLGMEYFCTEGDDLWLLPDGDLVSLAASELAALGLAEHGEVEDGVVFRQRQAYPVYDQGYVEHLHVIRRFLTTLPNLQTIGRNGMHRYNNMDHSMLTGMLAARNLLGEDHDLWSVNADSAYGEQLASL